MKKTLSAFLFLIFALAPHVAVAQQTALAIVVQSCGTAPYTYVKGQRQPVVQDVNGNVCTTAAVTASISGFQTTSYGTPISATTGGVTGSIPSNAGEFVAQNVGTFGAFCKTGASVNTAGQYLSPNGGWFAYAVTSETQITCEGVGGTTTVNLFGGTGLPTGTGGGGGGAVTWAGGTLGAMANYGTSPGAVLVPGVNAYVTGSTPEGGIADAAYNGTGSASLISINKGLYNVLTSPLPQGNNLIGYTTSDPCSYGTKITINIGQTATSKIISGSPGKKTYICTGAGFTSAAAVYGIEEGTGSVCGTGTHDVAGMNGSNNGTPFMSLAANGGLTFGAGSGSHIVVGNAAGDDVCIVQSGTANFSGWVSVVQQ